MLDLFKIIADCDKIIISTPFTVHVSEYTPVSLSFKKKHGLFISAIWFRLLCQFQSSGRALCAKQLQCPKIWQIRLHGVLTPKWRCDYIAALAWQQCDHSSIKFPFDHSCNCVLCQIMDKVYGECIMFLEDIFRIQPSTFWHIFMLNAPNLAWTH